MKNSEPIEKWIQRRIRKGHLFDAHARAVRSGNFEVAHRLMQALLTDSITLTLNDTDHAVEQIFESLGMQPFMVSHRTGYTSYKLKLRRAA